jgi:hypothetical protein
LTPSRDVAKGREARVQDRVRKGRSSVP